MDDSRLEQAFHMIREVVADAEKRGADKMWAKLLSMAPDTVRRAQVESREQRAEPEHQPPAPPAVVEHKAAEQPVEDHSSSESALDREPQIQRSRARQGIVREIIMRELKDAPPPGLTPMEISNRVRSNPNATEEELNIPDSSYRSELRAGGIAKRYVSSNGKWMIAEGAPKDGAEVEEEKEAESPVQETLLPASSVGDTEGR